MATVVRNAIQNHGISHCTQLCTDQFFPDEGVVLAVALLKDELNG